MKNIIIVVCVVLCISSCAKKQCYECVMYSDFGHNSQPCIDTSIQCDWTHEQMQEQCKVMSKYWDNNGEIAVESLTCTIK